ncbi:hypothetical protein AWW67_09720 [Roseivirga seohaensis]|uniref:Type I restriction modification DNA specificity domain-containing protein n=1 Tax=Roseivirga seohaensis TaxID=1914963 RepID=A0A150XPC4_9BACT|nr:restriction endonuclease subunit S [Roseivirga seohaensis]KYG80442.1 hypothetical protein AWW67_09720 [Roseivirga seohaensis]
MKKEYSDTQSSSFTLFEKLKSAKKDLISNKLILDKKDSHSYPIKAIPFNIPNHWKWCFLSDISIIQEGPGIRKHQYQDNGIQFLTVTNILEGSVDLEKSQKYISSDEYNEKYKHYKINSGDIVTACSGASWGKSAIYEGDEILMLNTSTLRLRFFNDLGDNRYLYYLTKSDYFKANLASHSTGQQPNYGYSHYSKIPIPLPPLNEQQRIVSILDQAFAAIDKAKANAAQNLQNAKELFESYLQGVFEKKGDGWEEKKLGEIAKINYGYTEKASTEEVGPKFLRITDIQEYGVDWDTVPYCKCNDKDLPKYKLETGDIVFARTGATTGKSYLVKSPPNAVFASYLIRLQMNSIDEFIPEFISYFFQTKTYWNKINAGISGSAQGGFNATKLGELEFDFPKSKDKQLVIVHQLDALRAETQKLEAVYQKKMDDLEELKKSILQKAFTGELTEKEVAV